MRQNYFKPLGLLLCVVLLSACGSATKKPEIVIDKAATTQKVILSDAQKKTYQDALNLLSQSKFNEAKPLFLSLIKQQPTLTGAFVNLGVIELANKDALKAESYFNQALTINPNFVDALLQKALISQEKGEFTGAETLLRRAVALQPDNPLVNYNLGVLYELYLQDYSLAIQHYKRYVDVSTADDVDVVKRWILLLERK